MSNLALELIEKNKQSKSTFLDLGNCGLINFLPDVLFDCIWLERLNLGCVYLDDSLGYSVNSNNKIAINYFGEYDFSILEKLPDLNALFISDSKIYNISSLSSLINLKYLGLGNNHIIDISPLNTLTNLIGLGLRFNRISNIKSINNLIKLEALDLAVNNIHDIKVLENFSYLTSLDIHANQITDIDSLTYLTKLLHLYISSNKVQEFTPLSKLVQIQTLFLSNLKVRNIEFLQDLLSLETLLLVYNEIEEFTVLEKLKNLKNLHINGNKIENINFLSKITKLEVLSLKENLIYDISPLSSLLNIKELNLSDNRIDDIGPLITHKNLEILYIDNNPFEEKYNLVLNKGENHWDIIKINLERLAEAGKKTKITLPVKILLLGNHASGKSSLLHYLQHNNFKHAGKSTHLLNIELYPLKNKNPNAIFYDFGGQDYYHGIYRTFLSVGSVYILLWNRANNDNKTIIDSSKIPTQNFTIGYWLGQKGHFENTNYSPLKDSVLLVQTHAQENEKPAFINENIFNNIEKTFFVSLSDNFNPKQNQTALQYLKTEIEALISSKKVEKEEQEWFVKFFKFILNAKKTQAIPINDLLIFYTPENKTDVLKSLHSELEQFHNQGLVLYYPKINADIVWLNPSGLVQYIHNNILQKDKLNKYSGIVPQNILSKFDQNIISLLKEQKVVFEHLWGNNGDIEYIIPNFLPLAKSNEVEFDLYTFGLNNPSFVLKFKDFLPIGLINQLICFFGRQPDIKKFWRDQLLFTFEKKCKVLIQIDFDNLEIKVFTTFLEITRPSEKENILKYFYYCLISLYWDKDIHDYQNFIFEKNDDFIKRKENLENYNKNIIVPGARRYGFLLEQIYYYKSPNYFFGTKELIPKDLLISLDDIHFINALDLFNHDSIDTKIKAYIKLSDGMLIEKSTVIPVKPFEIFTNKKMTAMKKVFISYSKDDLSMVHRFRDALVPLHDDGIIESPWYCTFLEAGSNWDKEIQQKLKESDIVFFMCSMSFIRTKYIREHEIKTAIEADKNIIPVIINFCEWDNYLGDYTALPYTSKPVADFKNQDLAWLLVTKGVRWSLETDEAKKEELNKQVRQLYERLVEGKLDA